MHQPVDPEQIAHLEREQLAQATRLNELEARIAALEEAAARQVPWSWPTPTSPTILPDSHASDRCGVCGGLWANMTHYMCYHPECPSRVTCSYIGDPPPGSPGHVQFTCGGADNSAGTTLSTAAQQLELAKQVRPPRVGDSLYGR